MRNLLRQRNTNLDIARIIAAVAVVMIHCGAMFMAEYTPHTQEFMIGNLFESVSQLGVPLFVMVSGVL